MIRTGTSTPAGSGGLRHQGGFVRGAIVLFVIVTVVGVFVLDILSVYTAHSTLDAQTRSAAVAAATTYVQLSNDTAAEQAAAQYLSDHGSTLVKIVSDHTNGINVYTVTASRVAKTYVFHYLAKLPKVGGWIDRHLHPVVSGDNSQ
jgi:hypothetical protein